MAEMFDLISKFADTSLQDGQHKNDLISKGEFKKIVYFEFVGDKTLFRMQVLMDLYILGMDLFFFEDFFISNNFLSLSVHKIKGKTLSKEQGILQLFKMCDRLFGDGFLDKMNWLLSILGILPTVESFSLDNLHETFSKLEYYNIYLDEKFINVCYSLDSDHLFSYMFSILLCILIPIQENQFNQFLHISFGKFNNCLELKGNEQLFQLYIELLCPPFQLIEHYRRILNSNNLFEKELLNSIEYNAFANGVLREMCYHFLSIIKEKNERKYNFIGCI